MVGVIDFRNGLVIEYENEPYQILWFQNHKTAMSGAIMRVKFRNLHTGTTIERTFKPAEKFREITPSKRPHQYLYAEGDNYHFMDMQTYDQIFYSKEKLGDSAKYLRENMEVEALF